MGGSTPRAPAPPPAPSPAATPMPGSEEELAKKVVRKRTGRESTILAGRMMQENNPYEYKTILGG